MNPILCTNLTLSGTLGVQITPEVIQLDSYWGG